MISKVGWQEAKQLLDMYNQESSPLLGKGKEIIEFLKPVLEYISKGNQMNQESIKITLEKSYKTFKSAEMKTLFEVKRRVYDEKIKFVDRVKNKLNNGIEVFKEEFSDYISQKDIQE